MKNEKTTTSFTCDMCGAENILPVNNLYKQTVGHVAVGGSAFGIAIAALPFGDYREHICGKCANHALAEAYKKVIAP